MLLTPADFYAPDAFARELPLFARGWVPACRVDEVLPGTQKRVQVATTDVLLTRHDDGALHAVSNVCRHRGLTLVEDTASGALIRCPYHLWTYASDGRLVAAPFMESTPNCDLPRYAVAEWGGFVFVNLDHTAPPLSEMLAPLAAQLKPEQLSRWRIGYRLTFDHAWNWKIMLENFAESYHHIGAHVQTLQQIWPGGESDATASNDKWIELHHSSHPDFGTFSVYVIYPTFLFALSEPATSAFWYRMTPLGPERIALDIIGLFPEEIAADAAAVEASKAQLMAVHLEDIPMCERTQSGLKSADAVLGPLSHLEAGVASFRDWVARNRA
ncbi:MAG TPA: aromatic ring-hydroxylating dioxygenase subunit alpha [Rhizomicrobium sp.]|jgi:phenylpropionate dioxygenase-like ring-hydroxylating dioxygenase large terminal subunit|nr:aromatic ring-hydroxylating dioxygenase subunit alpha [Rhizomicrobium sp.]